MFCKYFGIIKNLEATRKKILPLAFSNAWDIKSSVWEREINLECVSLTRNAWEMTGLCNAPMTTDWRKRITVDRLPVTGSLEAHHDTKN